MKPKYNAVDSADRLPLLSTQDKSFIRLAAAILEQSEETIIKSLVKKRAGKPLKNAA